MKIFKGNFVFSKSKDELVEFSNGYLLVDDEGIIVDLYKEIPTEYKALEAVDLKGDVVIPSFSDLHVHAPQYPNRGIAMDKLLADWLNDYTFPLESKYKDPEFAKAVYSKFVDNMIKQGTMHAVVFGTIHNEATNILAQEFEKRGIMARI
ncbi:MAG: amidohydrolase family protein, partial [Bacilli bacterium]|nr:amidohydrolase family protein [Bacilli bacterium]